ncbi:MAG: BREX-3 system P-loop-containing protein BrxF [Fibrobacter sp.]|nr:BREX-3 system P-loop-containing protein BrxF [Fibrobacter sp.]
MQIALSTLLSQASSLRFKLLAIIGKDEEKKNTIIDQLKKKGWALVNVERELLELHSKLESAEADSELKIGEEIKEWFNNKLDKIILTNASILYHEMFLKISPIGAFKYNSRNKNCVLFLEDETLLGSRLYHGQAGKEDYYDQEINDIIKAKIEEISLIHIEEPETAENKIIEELPDDAIGKLINFQTIKDVIDIDADLKGLDRRKEIVGSYVISDSLESQIIEFFDNIVKPNHKAITVIGNYGSGKSHLIGFLVSLIEEKALIDAVKNERIKEKAKKLGRKFFTVQFELQSGQVPLNRWFFVKVRQQLKKKYDIDIPEFDAAREFDDKENIARIVSVVKAKDPTAGLLVVIDEISDFLASKQIPEMRADLQFLRVLGQVCQDQDIMFMGSMQEDVFTSPKFKNVAEAIGRVEERFQYIIIHKEDIKKVLSQRIVSKNEQQRCALENLFRPFAAKIDDVSRNIDEYVDLFPLTPFILELFSDLPYFEKRGVIQFAMSEIKQMLGNRFPAFITFDRIYDILEMNPNKKNLEEVYDISRVMQILKQKINLLDSKYIPDALKIVKGLAVYSLWNKREKGATAQELANNLMVLPEKELYSAADNIGLIIRKIREVTDGEYIKAEKDEAANVTYFRFETRAGVDPEQKIAQVASTVSDSEIENEISVQLREILELEPISGFSDLFNDECSWQSVKSYRPGYILFTRKGASAPQCPQRDYLLEIVSPYAKETGKSAAKHHLAIKLNLEGAENIEIIKEIVAIRNLINNNFQKHIMSKKLENRINGYEVGKNQITGLKYRMAKLVINFAECELDGEKRSIKAILGRERASLPEIFEELKTNLLDKPFCTDYPEHPVYSIALSSRNINQSLSTILTDLTRGDFTTLGRSTKVFLQSINMLDTNEFPDTSRSPIIHKIYDTLKANGNKVTDINGEIVQPLQASAYGLEPEMICFLLSLLTVQGKVFLQAKGGDRIDINNIREKIKSLSVFENIAYAKLHEDYSYDFAARLLTTLGLNGQKITIEKERLASFREYKEKVAIVLRDIGDLKATVEHLREKQKVFVDLQALTDAVVRLDKIDWKSLDIANHTQFASIEKLNNSLSEIKLLLEELKNLLEALREYDAEIYEGILYMEDANRLIRDHTILTDDTDKVSALMQITEDVKKICGNYQKFTNRAERNPVKGKIQQFKKIFIFDIYIPAHEKYVGRKCDWNILDRYTELDEFRKISLLNKVTCIPGTTFLQRVDSWNKLKAHKCINPSLDDNLETAIRCPHCSFPQDYPYTSIGPALNSIETTLAEMLENYEKIIVKEVREYRDNLEFIESAPDKAVIEQILASKKLPDQISSSLVTALNELFREIDVVELERESLIGALFPTDELITIEQLRKRFIDLENSLKKNRQERVIRIKLK